MIFCLYRLDQISEKSTFLGQTFQDDSSLPEIIIPTFRLKQIPLKFNSHLSDVFGAEVLTSFKFRKCLILQTISVMMKGSILSRLRVRTINFSAGQWNWSPSCLVFMSEVLLAVVIADTISTCFRAHVGKFRAVFSNWSCWKCRASVPLKSPRKVVTSWTVGEVRDTGWTPAVHRLTGVRYVDVAVRFVWGQFWPLQLTVESKCLPRKVHMWSIRFVILGIVHTYDLHQAPILSHFRRRVCFMVNYSCTVVHVYRLPTPNAMSYVSVSSNFSKLVAYQHTCASNDNTNTPLLLSVGIL